VDGQVGRGRGAGSGQFLEHDARVQPWQAEPAVRGVGVQAAKAQLTGLAQGVAREEALRVPLGRMRRHRAGREFACGLLIGPLILRQLEVHVSVLPLSAC
jgi:hypothetical protein